MSTNTNKYLNPSLVMSWVIFLRCFIAWEENAAVDPDREHRQRISLEQYKGKLCVRRLVLPDPFTLADGWCGEDNKAVWPSLYFTDIADYLRPKTPYELYHRLCNEYKQGKGYR